MKMYILYYYCSAFWSLKWVAIMGAHCFGYNLLDTGAATNKSSPTSLDVVNISPNLSSVLLLGRLRHYFTMSIAESSIPDMHKEIKLTVKNELSLSKPLFGGSSRNNTLRHPLTGRQNKYEKKVKFGKQSVLHFRGEQPVNQMNKATPIISIAPLNCEHRVGKGEWLSDLTVLRTAPYCQLDYIKSYNKYSHEEDSLFHLDDGHDLDELEIIGEVAVYNVDYCKRVTIKYSFDNWKSTQAVEGQYCGSISTLRIDKFKFRINSSTISESVTLKMAICYKVGGNVFWDNNEGKDYQFSVVLSSIEPVCEETYLESTEDESDIPVHGLADKIESKPIPIKVNGTCGVRFSSLPIFLEQSITVSAYYSMVSSWDPAHQRHEQLRFAEATVK